MRVHVIGNAAFDETLVVEEWPEPGASILGRMVAAGPGGKGANQAVVLARAGVATRFVAGVGADARGTAIRAALGAEPLTLDLVEIAGAATDFSLVLSGAEAENAIVTTNECAGALTPEMIRGALAEAAPGDALLVQGNLTGAATRAALAAGRARGLWTVMNPSPIRPWQRDLLALCDCVVVNTVEARTLAGGATGAGAARLFHALGVAEVILTRGADGALLSGPNGIAEAPAAAAARIADTTGAGDAFLGAALAARVRTGRLDPRALDAGARAAALTIGRRGAFAALPSEAEMAAILG
jgi:ribokinase